MGIFVEAKLHEENLFASFYNNEDIFQSLGKELCISLNAALGSSGCKAIVEGFHSVVASHKKSGGQGNTILAQRAVVDWSIPDPVLCPETIVKIASLYTDEDKKRGIKKHRSAEFFDGRRKVGLFRVTQLHVQDTLIIKNIFIQYFLQSKASPLYEVPNMTILC